METSRYMVAFDLPLIFTEDMEDTIPAQRKMVENLFMNGKLVSYTLSADRSKLWAIFNAKSEAELINYVEKLPMTQFFTYEYYQIMFSQMQMHTPSFSLN